MLVCVCVARYVCPTGVMMTRGCELVVTVAVVVEVLGVHNESEVHKQSVDRQDKYAHISPRVAESWSTVRTDSQIVENHLAMLGRHASVAKILERTCTVPHTWRLYTNMMQRSEFRVLFATRRKEGVCKVRNVSPDLTNDAINARCGRRDNGGERMGALV